jgi:UDP-sulfoquinovose synthase
MKFIFTAVAFLLPIATSFSPVSISSRAVTKKSPSAIYAENSANGADAEKKKKVIVLGGDGFCGWPTSLYLSDQGHDVVIVDNLSRRKIDLDLGCDSLTPISSPEVSIHV